MASSTSNSKSWTISWVAAVILLVATLGVYETKLAQSGYRPSVAMNEDLWAWHRSRASSTSSPEPVVLLGASRMLLNISTETLEEHFKPREVILLALNGRYPLAALEDLANDPTFSGTVIVALNAQALEPARWGMQQNYIDYYHHKASDYRSFDAMLMSHLQSIFRFANTDFSALRLIEYYDQHGYFKPVPHTTRAADLSIRADFELTEDAAWQRHFEEIRRSDFEQNPPLQPASWQQQAQRLNQLNRKILSRGGAVALVRMPTSHGLWLLEEEHYPKDTYWDYLATNSPAHTVHFQDMPGVVELYLPDSSHLDFRDREAFTRALIASLIH